MCFNFGVAGLVFDGATQNYVTPEGWEGIVIVATNCNENLGGVGIMDILLCNRELCDVYLFFQSH